jgi:hypothetical protein
MKRVLTLVTGAVVFTLLLAACTTTVTSSRLQFSLSESGTLGYEIDDQGVITIENRALRFRNAAGAYGVTISEYTITFFNTGGVPLSLNDSTQTNSVSLFVPPGIQCDAPDPVYGCAVGEAGWRFAPGAEVVSPQSFQLLPGAVAIAHAASGFPVGWYAEIEFTGFDTMNRSFVTEPYFLTVTAPD